MSAEKRKGLIVDDLPAARVEIREHAEAMNHEFKEAASVEEARGFLASEEFDYVVLDLQLPMRAGRPDKIEHGKALLGQIVKDHPYVAVIVVTAHGRTDEHIVDVMSRSPLVTYVGKPFDERPGSTRLTEQIQAVLGRAESYSCEGRIPGTAPPTGEDASPPEVATIDVRKIRRHRNMGSVCLVNGEERVFSDKQHDIVKAFADAQRGRLGSPDQHSTPVNADAFNIKDDYSNRHPTMSRLRKKLRGFLPQNYPNLVESVGDRMYSLGCICFDSTSEE